MDMQAVRSVLLEEARELLATYEHTLLEVEAHGLDGERINAIFRAAHTLKGSSGMFNLQLVVSFTHLLENLLVRVRSGEQPMDGALISLLLRCGDYLSRLFDKVALGLDDEDPDPALRAELSAALADYLGEVQVLKPLAGVPVRGNAQDWLIGIHCHPELFHHGLDPLPFIQYLIGMGELLELALDRELIPSLEDIDPETCYFKVDLLLRTDASREALLQALEFIQDDCDISLEPLEAVAAEAPTEPVAVEPAPLAAALDSGEPSERAPARRDEQMMIKVDARKLDQLIDAVGELVTRSARCRTLSQSSAREAVETFVEEVDDFIEQLRDRALELRMAPINEVFQRFPRVVRDVARDLGKEVELQIRGAETELDKTMLDKLADPLLHIVRNALDHGIEPVEARRAAGKPARGRLLLNAYHESGSVVLEISDDGRGLNAAKIRARAIERGLIGAETLLDEQGIFALIFEAGFSTAEQVTDLSGRGVGMDVVRRSIEALRGSIEIQSTMGQGTCFRIRLPLTLSIIDGFQVVVGEARFVIPLEQVVECLELPKNASANQVMSLRGTPLSYLRLAELFELPRDPAARECLVVVQHGQQRTGIVVDRFAGELQAVIKPLNPMLRNVPGLGGSTILGDGRVALILDINSLLATPRRVEHA
ncbi:chemotaxis protein CheA [Pseudomonas flexibilis]|uniref:Chemotaxis protein CheA n=1 Tax=Pseudomonas flexibilis TaxID=706570 RepID=A0A0B3BTY8_9PSED|nr:chemotaxis protein CheA [Pseudomonas flexibilis]KHO66095.1 hypothetical protein PT85_00420 [Pseudomonas flexibilis]SCY51589.1 two-component system, chemotaxis family, sensor kinase CheA [Pseudomonas flexibilis]